MSTRRRKALVTGGSDGLGLHVARQLADRGYQVTIVGRNGERLNAAVATLRGESHRAMALDLSTRGGASELAAVVERDQFDVLVNNAGATQFGAQVTIDDAVADAIIQLNLTTPVLLSRTYLKTAPAGGVLVNVTSIVGTLPVPGNAIYCGAKAGLQTVTECLWYEMQGRDVRVLDFRPVRLSTDFHEHAGRKSVAPGGSMAPDAAARLLIEAIEGGREFVLAPGLIARAIELTRRVLPRRMQIRLMGRQAKKMGYL